MEHDQCDLPGGGVPGRAESKCALVDMVPECFLDQIPQSWFVLFLIIKYRRGVGVTHNSCTQR